VDETRWDGDVRRDAVESNRELWDEWTRIHLASEEYAVDRFREGGVRLRAYELEELGDVRGLRILHLQCHFGIDTLSFARLGASVTGIDFSPRAIAAARGLAADLGLDATFIESDVYEAPRHVDGHFDLVYTSRGVLGWLPEVRGWARVAAGFVRPGGRFYLAEIHPVLQAMDDAASAPPELRLKYPYWEHREPLRFPVQGSYADPTADVDAEWEHGWNHGLGEIVSALAEAGLRIESLREYPFAEWAFGNVVVRHDDGTYRLPEGAGELPLSFSLLATRDR
jgi:SAM-dependent methyltransferase